MHPDRPYLLVQGAAALVWTIGWAPGTTSWHGRFDDPVATAAITLILGVLPAAALGWLCGWLQRKRPAAFVWVVAGVGLLALAWASINTFLSGELFFCSPCEGPSGTERIAGGVAMEVMLLVVWGVAALTRRRR